jgi:hypothetical protein
MEATSRGCAASATGSTGAVVRGDTGDQTDQESRSAGPHAAASVTAMDITVHASFLPRNDPDASTVGPADQSGTSICGLPVRF